MRGLLVTGTDTGVGKTVLSAALLAAMSAAGERVRAFKPVVTGIDEQGNTQPTDAGERGGALPADHELLASMSGMEAADVAPLRYGPAVSPHLAAALAGERIDPERLLSAARSTSTDAELVVVEGVGGLLVPLDADYTVCDFAVALGLPVLIAARAGLGTINHTLLTLRVARAAGLDVRAVVLTPWPAGPAGSSETSTGATDSAAAPSELERSNRETIARLGAVEVEVLERVPSPAGADLARAGATLPWQRWVGPADSAGSA